MDERTKPHLGKIKSWFKRETDPESGLGYQIIGMFVDHPDFKGEVGHTSYVVSHDETTGEIETRNSRYTLEGAELIPKSHGF